jgi:hypothetical protein
MSCTCVYCGRCNGTGHIWVNYDHLGRVISDSGLDDLSDLDPCPECYGRGLTEMCDECREAEEREETL